MASVSLRELQAYIRNKDHDPARPHDYLLKLVEEVGELADAIRRGARMQGDQIVGSLEEELYDVLYYVAALANIYAIDLERCYELKEAFNRARYGQVAAAGDSEAGSS